MVIAGKAFIGKSTVSVILTYCNSTVKTVKFDEGISFSKAQESLLSTDILL